MRLKWSIHLVQFFILFPKLRQVSHEILSSNGSIEAVFMGKRLNYPQKLSIDFKSRNLGSHLTSSEFEIKWSSISSLNKSIATCALWHVVPCFETTCYSSQAPVLCIMGKEGGYHLTIVFIFDNSAYRRTHWTKSWALSLNARRSIKFNGLFVCEMIHGLVIDQTKYVWHWNKSRNER